MAVDRRSFCRIAGLSVLGLAGVPGALPGGSRAGVPGGGEGGAMSGFSRADVCAVAVAEAFRGDGEVLASCFGTVPAVGARLARATFEPGGVSIVV